MVVPNGWDRSQRSTTDYRRAGGLAPKRDRAASRPLGRVDQRWVDVALEMMVEHTGESTPSRTMVIDRTNARVVVRSARAW